jgi:PAS domain S-box-containing protein
LLLHLEHSPLAVVEWDSQFRIKRWAGSAEALFGYSADEMVGRSIENLGIIHPDDVDQVAGVTAELRDRAPERVVSHNRNVTKSGRVLYCAWHNTVTRDRTGKLQSVLSLVLDETAECEAEAAAERAAEQLDLAQRAAKAGIWDAEISSGKVTWSAAYRELYGLASDAVASFEGWIETIHPEDRERTAAEVHRALETHAPLHLEFRIVHRGQVRWLETTGSTTYADDGHPLRMSGITIDITARKEAEAALHARSAELQALVSAAPVAIVALDRRGVVRDWSPAAEQLFGWRADEVLGQRLPFIPPEQNIRDTPSQAALERAESFHGIETERLRKDGSRVPVAVWAAPLRAADGSVEGCLALFTDLTEGRRQEQALREAQKLEAVGKLAGGMAHEVNNQLTAILGFASFLARSLPQGDKQQRDVQQIQRAAERAATVTRQVLAFSRRQLLQPTVVDLNALVEGLEPLVRSILGAEHVVTIETGSQPARVLADPTSLEAVITNLALNARDAMPAAGRMTLAVDEIVVVRDDPIHKRHPELEPGPYVRLQVSDTGSGMTEAIRARAFEPFFTTKPLGEGTGLGLATVYGTVRQLAGMAEIDSTVGAGTTVCIFLPRVVAAPPSAPAHQPTPERGGGETVLVVDDEPGVRKWLVRCLTEGGYQVIQAPDGPQALAKLAAHGGTIRAVVSDVKMPRMNGRELAARIAERWPHLPVLFISGFSGDELVERGLLDPGVPLLRKPFDAAALGAALRRLLGRTQPEMAPRE